MFVGDESTTFLRELVRVPISASFVSDTWVLRHAQTSAKLEVPTTPPRATLALARSLGRPPTFSRRRQQISSSATIASTRRRRLGRVSSKS